MFTQVLKYFIYIFAQKPFLHALIIFKVKTLREDQPILRKHTVATHPNDFPMFLELRDRGSALLCPLNTFSTHGETMWLAPLYKTKQENLINEWKNHL